MCPSTHIHEKKQDMLLTISFYKRLSVLFLFKYELISTSIFCGIRKNEFDTEA